MSRDGTRELSSIIQDLESYEKKTETLLLKFEAKVEIAEALLSEVEGQPGTAREAQALVWKEATDLLKKAISNRICRDAWGFVETGGDVATEDFPLTSPTVFSPLKITP